MKKFAEMISEMSDRELTKAWKTGHATCSVIALFLGLMVLVGILTVIGFGNTARDEFDVIATRWGSCSGKGNLNFNCLLMLFPDDVIDSVVVHELCHIHHHNHSAAFWTAVAQVMPDYKQRQALLRD